MFEVNQSENLVMIMLKQKYMSNYTAESKLDKYKTFMKN